MQAITWTPEFVVPVILSAYIAHSAQMMLLAQPVWWDMRIQPVLLAL